MKSLMISAKSSKKKFSCLIRTYVVIDLGANNEEQWVMLFLIALHLPLEWHVAVAIWV